MKYIIREGKPDGAYNASSKARNDVDAILTAMAYQPFYINTVYGVQRQKWKKPLQLLAYQKNGRIWMDCLKQLKSGDEIVIQYPLLNTTYGFERFLRACEDRGIRTIAVIHDMDSLRYTEEIDGRRVVERVQREDRTFLPAFGGIICHNESMKQVLLGYGVDEDKLVCLQIFDYLVDFQPREHERTEPVIIAGNLNPQKVQYLKYLDQIDYDFNLYGIGYEDLGSSNVRYQGAFKPEELLDHLTGAFGLVWDGKSKDGCRGGWGDYLRYNNPHKASLYLASGIPVIIWREAALAGFIEKGKLGVTIADLSDIEQLPAIPEEAYREMQDNCRRMAKEIQTGQFLRRAIEQLEKRM